MRMSLQLEATVDVEWNSALPVLLKLRGNVTCLVCTSKQVNGAEGDKRCYLSQRGLVLHASKQCGERVLAVVVFAGDLGCTSN